MIKSNITLTTWNILNPSYAISNRYGISTHPYLNWDEGRKNALHKYMATMNSDIYCLQESTNAIAKEITIMLEKNSNRNYTLLWANRKFDSDDGCAIIYDEKMFNLCNAIIHNHNDTHIIQAILFENINKNRFWCFNTHINFMTRNEDIFEMLKISNLHPFDGVKKIIVGDFNAEINESWYKQLENESYIDAWTTKNGEHNNSDFTFSNGNVIPNKWIDFVLLNGFTSDDINDIYIDKNINTNDMKYLPNIQIPSDHFPQTIVFKL